MLGDHSEEELWLVGTKKVLPQHKSLGLSWETFTEEQVTKRELHTQHQGSGDEREAGGGGEAGAEGRRQRKGKSKEDGR